MPALAGQYSAAIAKVESSPDGVTWTDRSNGVISAAVAGGERPVAQTNTLDGSTYTTTGNPANATVTGTVLVTKVATEPYRALQAIQAAGTRCDLRITLGTGVTGDLVYTYSNGRLTGLMVPSPDGNSGDALTSPFAWSGPVPVISVVV